MDRSAYDRFRSDEEPEAWDTSSFRMGVNARKGGGKIDASNPFWPGGWLSKSWRAGWCDEDQSQLTAVEALDEETQK